MKREEVIEIGELVGLLFGLEVCEQPPLPHYLMAIERFAAEVERRTIERCAQVADGADKYNRHISREIAAGIRALANQQEK